MPTFLKKLFKPKWQHSNPEVRKAAIAGLNSSDSQDLKVLVEAFLTETHDEIRQTALIAINQPDTLIQLYKSAHAGKKQQVESRLLELIKSTGKTLQETIPDPHVRLDMILHSNAPMHYIDSFNALSQTDLKNIVEHAKTATIRQSALEYIEDESVLQSLIKQAKGKDKKIYQITKNKLNDIRNIRQAAEQEQQKIEQLVQAMEQHAASSSEQMYVPKLDALKNQWIDLETKANATQKARIQTALDISQAKAQSISDRLAKAQHEQALATEKAHERQSTIGTLAATESRFQKERPYQSTELSALDALVKTQENRWIEATKNADIDKTEQKEYVRLMQSLKGYLRSASTLEQNKQELESLNQSQEEHDTTRIRQLLIDIDWPSEFIKPELLTVCEKIVGKLNKQRRQQESDSKAALARIKDKLEAFEYCLEAKQLKESQILLKEIQQLQSEQPELFSPRYQSRLSLLQKQLKDLADWKGYAISPKQQELCEHMELLASQSLEPELKATKIRELQQEWRELGGSTNKALWERFKAAADHAYEPCKAFQDAQSELKSTNLTRRQTIINELTSFFNNCDWQTVNWKGVEAIARQARQDWKDSYPIDFKANRPLQARFNTLLEQLDEKLQQEREQNRLAKQALVDQAEKLIEHEPLSEAISTIKDLQAQWKLIGITLHKEDRVLWKGFRAACDRIFERRNEASQKRQAESQAAKQSVDALLDNLAVSITQEGADLNTILSIAKHDISKLTALTKTDKSEADARFQELKAQTESQLQEQARQSFQLQLNEMKRKSSIAREVYRNSGDLLSGESYESLTTLPNIVEEAFSRLWSGLSGYTARTPEQVKENALEACLLCEILTEVPSLPEEQDKRLQLQVDRLAKGLNNNHQQAKIDQLWEVLANWYCLPEIDDKSLSLYQARIDHACTQFMSK